MKDIWINSSTVITMPDAFYQQIVVRGRIWRFDYCRRGGPLWLRKDWVPRACQCPTDPAVWRAFNRWLKHYNRFIKWVELRPTIKYSGEDLAKMMAFEAERHKANRLWEKKKKGAGSRA